MELSETVGEQLVEAAFAEARKIGVDIPAPSLQAMNAPVPGEADTWITRIWDQVEGALRKARSDTREAVDPIVERAFALYEEAKQKLGKGLEAVTAVLLDRLNAWMNSILDGVLKTTRASLTIGDEVLRISSATISRSLSLSGSFELSLDRVLKAVADSEFSLNVEYTSAN